MRHVITVCPTARAPTLGYKLSSICKTKYITSKTINILLLLLLLGHAYTSTDLHGKLFVQVRPGLALELWTSKIYVGASQTATRRHANSKVQHTSASLGIQEEPISCAHVTAMHEIWKKKGRSKTLLQQFHSIQNVLQNYQTTLKNARVLISTSLIRTTQQRNTQQHSRDYQATRQLFTLQNFTHDTTGVVLTNGRGCKQYRHERQTRTFCRCKI